MPPRSRAVVGVVEASLREEYDITRFDCVDGSIQLEYRASSVDADAVVEELLLVAGGAAAALIPSGEGLERVEATVHAPSGGTVWGQWRLERDWALEYEDGELSDKELLERIRETM